MRRDGGVGQQRRGRKTSKKATFNKRQAQNLLCGRRVDCVIEGKRVERPKLRHTRSKKRKKRKRDTTSRNNTKIAGNALTMLGVEPGGYAYALHVDKAVTKYLPSNPTSSRSKKLVLPIVQTAIAAVEKATSEERSRSLLMQRVGRELMKCSGRGDFEVFDTNAMIDGLFCTVESALVMTALRNSMDWQGAGLYDKVCNFSLVICIRGIFTSYLYREKN